MRIQDVLQPPMPDGRWVIQAQTVNCIIPLGMEAVETGWFSGLIAKGLTPAITYNHKVRFNRNVLPLLTVATVCHEFGGHGLQEFPMGRVNYLPTYIWHAFLTKVDHNHHMGTDDPDTPEDESLLQGTIHDDHTVEDEARRIGRELSRKVFADIRSGAFRVATDFFDIEAETRKLMN